MDKVLAATSTSTKKERLAVENKTDCDLSITIFSVQTNFFSFQKERRWSKQISERSTFSTSTNAMEWTGHEATSKSSCTQQRPLPYGFVCTCFVEFNLFFQTSTREHSLLGEGSLYSWSPVLQGCIRLFH